MMYKKAPVQNERARPKFISNQKGQVLDKMKIRFSVIVFYAATNKCNRRTAKEEAATKLTKSPT